MNLSLCPLALTLALNSIPIYGTSTNIGQTPHRLEASPKKIEPETCYLAFQIFTWSPNPEDAGFGRDGTTLPTKTPLLHYIQDIKSRIGTVGDRRNRLGFVLGPIGCFDQTDAEVANFIKIGFDLALETNVAVGIKIDDSMFWGKRKDLWSDPNNVEAMDWEGTPSTGRRLDWGKEPTQAPPQMCFNSHVIQQAVRHRAKVFGEALTAGIKRLKSLNKSELFAGVIAGSETMIGRDFATGKLLGYRALINRGFRRSHPPKDMDLELESVVKAFIDLWTGGLAEAGVPPQKIYSHTAFVSHRVFNLNDKQLSYSAENCFAPPSAAFGTNHRPGFSTYPQPGLFDDIFAQLAAHKQSSWASSEGTNLQLGAGPGHSGMNMETYLGKMFNHGATLVDVFSWGIGGKASRDNEFRQVTENDEALGAYRRFLRGDRLTETNTDAPTLLERLPTKIHRIQSEFPGWIQRTGRQAEAQPLMTELESALDVKDFDRAEKAADAILKLMDETEPSPTQAVTEEMRGKLRHEFGFWFLVYRDKVQAELGLSPEQKAALEDYLSRTAPANLKFLNSNEGHASDFETYRANVLNSLDSMLKKTLSDAQGKRLGEIVRQREGLFGGPSLWTGLQITDEEKSEFMKVIEPMHQLMDSIAAEGQHSIHVAEFQRHVLGLRADLERQLEAVLTESQRKQWKEMLGKPIAIDALYDLSGG